MDSGPHCRGVMWPSLFGNGCTARSEASARHESRMITSCPTPVSCMRSPTLVTLRAVSFTKDKSETSKPSLPCRHFLASDDS
jgi:hypothetical protein